MARPKTGDFRRIHLTLDRTQLARLSYYFGATIGVSEAIRLAINNYLSQHEAANPPKTAETQV